MTSSIQGNPVDPTPPNSGEGLIFNGTVYVPTPANPGDITAVNTTLPLTGGGTSGALTLDINNFTGDAGAGGLDGAVPAPAAGDAAAGKFLKADGTWAAPSGGGNFITYAISDVAKSAVFDTDHYNPLDVIESDSFVPTTAEVLALFEPGLVLADSGLAEDVTLTFQVNGVSQKTARIYTAIVVQQGGFFNPVTVPLVVSIGVPTTIKVIANYGQTIEVGITLTFGSPNAVWYSLLIFKK